MLSSSGPQAGRRENALDLLLLVFLAALIFVPSLPVRELWTPDEPRYMEVGREMAVTGDYIVPRLDGYPYPDKPPMFFWLAAGFYKLGFGYNAGRVVAALSGLATVLMVYSFARLKMSRAGALIAAVAVLTCPLFIEAKGGLIDPLLMAIATASVISGYNALQPATNRRTAWWLSFYFFAALGILTKGPPAVIAPLLATAGYAIVNRSRIRSGIAGHVLGGMLFLVIVLAWCIPAAIQGGAEYRSGVKMHLLGYAVGSFSHKQPFYFYLMMSPGIFFPWLPLLVLAMVWAVCLWRRSKDEALQFFLIWFGATFVFFSCMSGKRTGYLMPLLPAAGLLLGAYLSAGLKESSRWPRWHAALSKLMFVLYGLAALAGIAAVFTLPWLVKTFVSRGEMHVNTISQTMTLPVKLYSVLFFVALLALAAWGVALAKRRAHAGVFALAVAMFVLVSVSLDLAVAPRLNRFKSPKPFCDAILPYINQADQAYLLKNNMSGVYNLYTGRVHMPILTTTEEITKVLSGGTKVAIVAPENYIRTLIGEDFADCLVLAADDMVSSSHMELLINWDPKTGHLFGPPKRPFKPIEPKRKDDLAEASHGASHGARHREKMQLSRIQLVVTG